MPAVLMALVVGVSGERTARSADGVEIRYAVDGKGSPALVFVHCWACDRHLWDATVERFRERHLTVALDLGGHGESGRNRKAWTIEAFGADVAAVVEAEGLDKVVLVGHSMGGPVILEAAKRLGPRVAGLVPVDTLVNVETRPSLEQVERHLAPFRADFKRAAEELLRGYMFTPKSDPALVERLVRKTQAMPPEIAVAALFSSWSYDEQAAFEAVAARIVAINGDKFRTDVEANRRHAPGYRALIMTGVGHYLMLESPDGFARRLEEALAALRAS
jgi:pimeloyl-ACP methyl ester carboxylesterase